MSAASRGGAGARVALGVLAVAVVIGVILAGRARGVAAFEVDSSAPAGYAALGELLAERGVDVSSAPIGELLDPDPGTDDPDPGTDDPDPGGGAVTAVVVARPGLLSPEELDALRGDGSADGSGDAAIDAVAVDRVVLAGGAEGAAFGLDSADALDLLGRRALVETPAQPVPEGDCSLAELDGLGPVDAAFAPPLPVPSDALACYGELGGALVVRADPGPEGTEDSSRPVVTTVASPLLWVNARLQPDKENGGRPLANAAVALSLLDGVDRVVFVDPVPSAGVTPEGTQDPLSLLPLPVRLALAQLAVAVLIYLWWRARRVGPPPVEVLPVEVAGSELVVAIGDLLRRRGSAQRSAAALRSETRRVLASRLGAGDDLARAVAARTGRDPVEVAAALDGTGAPPVTSGAQLVALARTLDTIRQEALREPARP